MTFRQGLSTVLIVIALLSVAQMAQAKKSKLAEPGTPTRAVQDLDEMLNSYIIDPKTPKDLAFNRKLKKEIVEGTFDVRELCRLALDKHWQKISEKERIEFVDIMTRLLERKAIFSKEQSLGSQGKKGVQKYTLHYTGSRFLDPRKTKSLVNSHIKIPSESLQIDIDYKVKKVAAIWKIYDVIVDGASLLNNYRYQFDKIINKDGYNDLLRRMKSKLAELESSEK